MILIRWGPLQVIIALQERAMGKSNRHIPYRNSMMTTVLKDSLGGNCKTTMIATVTTKHDQLDESISTCRFAQRVAMVSNEVRPLPPPYAFLPWLTDSNAYG